jgi:hypothetical protein
MFQIFIKYLPIFRIKYCFSFAFAFVNHDSDKSKFCKKKFFRKIEEKNQRIYRIMLPQVAMRENLCTTNLPPEVKREYSLSYKFTAGGNA